MADVQETTTTDAGQGAQEPQGTAQPTPQGSGTDWKAEARKWEERAKADHARVAELEAKAAKLDEIEEAKKSDLERANEAAAKAQADASDWQAKYEALEAERQHEAAVRAAATTYGVDVGVLMRMGGDVDENAKFLQAREAARPKFGDMHDGGEHMPPAQTLEERMKGAKNTSERIAIRAEEKARRRARNS